MTTNRMIASRVPFGKTAIAAMPIEQRLRLFYLGLAAFMCVGTVAELLLLNHTDGGVQLIPFVLCGLGFVAILSVIFKPEQKTVWAMRFIMIITMIGSLFGMVEHLQGNLEFARELHASMSEMELFLETIQGANPLLAPGMLAVGALIALGASFYPLPSKSS